MNRLLREKGLTLVELLMAVFILSVGIGGVLLLFFNAMVSSEYAWDMTVATSHAESILEEMQRRKILPEVRNADWNKWAQLEGLTTLPEEAVSVEFAEGPGDPLDIRVEISWERKARSNTIELTTKMTK